MAERLADRALRVRTTGIREWHRGVVHYNRYEATPYIALDKLFETYSLDKTDELVDFGCGRGSGNLLYSQQIWDPGNRN